MSIRRFLTTDDLDSLSGGGGGGSGSSVVWKDVAYDVSSVALDVATNPDEIVATPGAGKAIVLLHAFVTNQGTGNIDFTFEDDAGAITHTITAGGNGGGGNISLGIECTADDALNVAVASGTATDLGITAFYITINV